MTIRITAANSRYVTSGNALEAIGPNTLIVDLNGYLIADSDSSTYAMGEGAKLTGSWTVKIDGFVGAFGQGDISHAVYRSALFLYEASASDFVTIAVGKSAQLHGSDVGIQGNTDMKLTNHGLIDGRSSISMYGRMIITNDGRLVGDVWGSTSQSLNDVFHNYTGSGKTMKDGIIVGQVNLGWGDDKFYGGRKAETVQDAAGSDSYNLGAGNDRYRASSQLSGGTDGPDDVKGGKGFDTYDASDASSPISINLDSSNWIFTPKHTATGSAIGTDKVFNFEKVIGTSGGDSFFGSSKNETFDGRDGSDWLFGFGGGDRLIGGAYDDTFYYFKISDSRPVAGQRDIIFDYTPGYDHISLINIDANGSAFGDGAFIFIGIQKFHGVRGELRTYFQNGDTFLVGDINGDRKADFGIQLKGMMLLDASDFDL